MELFRIVLETNPINFEVVPIHDAHFGSIFADEQSLKKLVNYIAENENTYFYLGGDILDAIPLKDKRFEAKNLSPKFIENLDRLLTFAVEYAGEFFEPIKHKCLWIQSGNHEDKYYREYGFDFIGLLAKFLGINNFTHSYEALAKILLKHNERTYSLRVYTHHGFGGGKYPGSSLNSLMMMAKNFDAMIYVAGHAHKLTYGEDVCIKMNSTGTRLFEENRLFIRVGGFRRSRIKGHYSYEEKQGMFPIATGTMSFYIDRLTSDKIPVLKARRLP